MMGSSGWKATAAMFWAWPSRVCTHVLFWTHTITCQSNTHLHYIYSVHTSALYLFCTHICIVSILYTHLHYIYSVHRLGFFFKSWKLTGSQFLASHFNRLFLIAIWEVNGREVSVVKDTTAHIVGILLMTKKASPVRHMINGSSLWLPLTPCESSASWYERYDSDEKPAGAGTTHIELCASFLDMPVGFDAFSAKQFQRTSVHV